MVMGNKWVLCVRTAYSFGNSWRPFVFELEKITPQCVYAAGYYTAKTRYNKRDFKFRYFDTEDEAKQAAYMVRFRCNVLDADRATEAAKVARAVADDLVKKEVSTWV